ncbi:MAG: hypothetical protein WBM02_10795 [bacterium]
MNTFDYSDNLMFDCRRLETLIQLWNHPDDTASPLFIALNLMDFTARLRRHKEYAQQTNVLLPDRCQESFELARQLITSDVRIGRLVFEDISFELFQNNLKQFIKQYDRGRLHDDEILETAADLTDHYFSTELVLDCAEHFLDIPAERTAEIKAFRSAFFQAVNQNLDLADAVRDYAETAPGGPHMAPWPALLEHAPDRLFDTVLMADILERMQRKDEPTIIDFNPVYFENRIPLPVAADTQAFHPANKIKELPDDGTFQALLAQYDDILVIEIFGFDLDLLPTPMVFMGDTEVTIQKYSESDLSRLSFKIGGLNDFFNKKLTISFPGTSVYPISLKIMPEQ